MLNVDLLSDRIARAKLERRGRAETERRERIFNDKERTTGVSKEALSMQMKQKKKQEVEAKEEMELYDANMLHNSKVAYLLQRKQVKEKRAIEMATVNYRHKHQQPWSQRDYDLNDPDRFRKTDPADAQMKLHGLVGDDPDCKSRQQRQREQLRAWLIQQQNERAAEKHQQKLDEQHYEQHRAEMDNKALQLQHTEVEKRKAVAMATEEYNLAQIKEKQQQRQQEGMDDTPSLSMVGVPGMSSNSEMRYPPGSLLQIVQFQKHQLEEKKRMEMEKRQEEEQHDLARMDSARAALLIERQQARLNKQLRRQLDSTNAKLAQIHKDQKPDIERGSIDNTFFSKFNNCSR